MITQKQLSKRYKPRQPSSRESCSKAVEIVESSQPGSKADRDPRVVIRFRSLQGPTKGNSRPPRDRVLSDQ